MACIHRYGMHTSIHPSIHRYDRYGMHTQIWHAYTDMACIPASIHPYIDMIDTACIHRYGMHTQIWHAYTDMACMPASIYGYMDVPTGVHRAPTG